MNEIEVSESPFASVVGGDAITNNIHVTILEVENNLISPDEALRCLRPLLENLERYHNHARTLELENAGLRAENSTLKSIAKAARDLLDGEKQDES